MTTTPQTEAGTGAAGTKAVTLQLSELVLKTARYDDMAVIYSELLRLDNRAVAPCDQARQHRPRSSARASGSAPRRQPPTRSTTKASSRSPVTCRWAVSQAGRPMSPPPKSFDTFTPVGPALVTLDASPHDSGRLRRT